MARRELYYEGLPDLLRKAAQAPCLLRLQKVGMNCSLEYTSFPTFARCRPYSRYEHSLGVAAIVWHFTHDARQALAGLLHDCSTPCFSHVVDFLRGDYLRQEATEEGTRAVIESSMELRALLEEASIDVSDVADYHLYPVADNDAPRLSADRLEYTLGNLWGFHLRSREQILACCADLTLGENEEGAPELMFSTRRTAADFAEGALICSRIYVSPEDRYTMQYLAELLRDAIGLGAIEEGDLMGTEPPLIEKLLAHPGTAPCWRRLCAFSRMRSQEEAPEPRGLWRRVAAKKRAIDPFVRGEGRLSALDGAFREALTRFLEEPQDQWLMAE